MKLPEKFKNSIKSLIVCALTGCVCLFSGCHVFPVFIPKDYDEAKMQEIYAFIKDDLLTGLNYYIANVSYIDPQDGIARYVDILSGEGKIIMTFADSSRETSSVYYEGTYKTWNVETQTETVEEKSVEEFAYLTQYVRSYADYLKNNVVGTDKYYDGYCHECIPWGIGMAQYYYKINDAEISASWTVQSGDAPLIFNAEFSYSEEDGDINIDVYAEPYGIDERIINILNSYESNKTSE